MKTWKMLSIQESASPLEQLTFIHDHVMLIVLLITILVGY